METRGGRLRKVRNLALLLTALSFLIVLVSVYIRLSGAGLGCAGWPDCYGQLLAGGPQPHVGAVRILHRITASLALLLAFYTAWLCIRPEPIQPVARQVTLLLVLMILLTFVGIWSSDPHRAWASFINIIGGAGLVLLSWRTALAAGAGADADLQPAPRGPFFILLHAGLGLLVLTIALGALIGARYAAIACASLPGCGDVTWPAAAGWSALNPFVTVAAATPHGDDGGVALHLLHRYSSLATLLLLGIGGLQALLHGTARVSAGLMLALLLVQFALGVLTVLSGFSLGLAVAHGVCAAALLAATVQLLGRRAA